MINVFSISPDTVRKWFLVIHGDLCEAIENSGGYATPGFVFDMLENGTWILYIFYRDTEYAGFGIIESIKTAKGDYINVPFAYSSGGLTEEFFNVICKDARDNGYVGVKFVSSRPGFEKIAKKLGWKKGFTEYIVQEFMGV